MDFILNYYPDSLEKVWLLAGLLTYSNHRRPSRINLSGTSVDDVSRAYSCGNSSGFTPDSLLIYSRKE